MGKSVSSFSLNVLTSEVWNTGKYDRLFGRSRVTVECFLSVAVMTYGPSNRGMNLATRVSSFDLYSRHLCAVESTMRSPVLNGKVVLRC